MKRGDKVIYTQSHYLWLVMAARWPSKYVPRRQFTGEVFAGSDGLDGRRPVGVRWDDGQHTWHFADNLEPITQEFWLNTPPFLKEKQ